MSNDHDGLPPLLSDERIEAMAVTHEAFGFGRVDTVGFTTHGFDPDGLRAFARAVESEVRASFAAELAALRVDAGRYRWLRESMNAGAAGEFAALQAMVKGTAEQMDAAIDQSLGKQPAQGDSNA